MNHLRNYSKEYFQLVKAVPELVQNIQENLKNNDAGNEYVKEVQNTHNEEDQHIQPWIKFAQSLGIEKQELVEYEGNSEVNLAITNLKKFYNIFTDEAITYFKIHQIADIEHARLWKTILLDFNVVGKAKVLNETIFNASVSSLNSQNQILDAIYNNYVKDTMN